MKDYSPLFRTEFENLAEFVRSLGLDKQRNTNGRFDFLVFMYLTNFAEYETKFDRKGHEIKAGEISTTHRAIALKLGLTTNQVDYSINRLESQRLIVRKFQRSKQQESLVFTIPLMVDYYKNSKGDSKGDSPINSKEIITSYNNNNNNNEKNNPTLFFD